MLRLWLQFGTIYLKIVFFVIANDFLSHETCASLFDLDAFKAKALDEIDFDLIKSAVITQDPSIVSFRSFINSATKMILF